MYCCGASVIGVDPPEDVLSFIQNIITCNIPDKETDPELPDAQVLRLLSAFQESEVRRRGEHFCQKVTSPEYRAM